VENQKSGLTGLWEPPFSSLEGGRTGGQLDRSSIVDCTVDLHLGTPEAMDDFSARYERGQVQPSPAVYTYPAEQSQHTMSLVLPMRPQAGDTLCQFEVRRVWDRTVHMCPSVRQLDV